MSEDQKGAMVIRRTTRAKTLGDLISGFLSELEILERDANALDPGESQYMAGQKHGILLNLGMVRGRFEQMATRPDLADLV